MNFDDFISKLKLLSHYYEESEGTILNRLLAQEIERIRPLLEKKGEKMDTGVNMPIPASSSASVRNTSYASANSSFGSEPYYIKNTAELSGSKPIRARFGENKDWEMTSWKTLFHKFLEMLVKDGYCQTDDILISSGAISINMKKGMESGRGYDYNEELDLSIQGNAAPINAEAIKRLCEKYNIPFDIIVRWNGDNAPEGVENGYFCSSEK